MSLSEFTAWVDKVLENASFIPAAASDAPSVFIAPIAHAALRSFAAVVLPGADEGHLGAPGSGHPLLTEAQAEALRLPTAAQRRDAQSLHFAHAVNAAPVNLFYRHRERTEPLACSPLVTRLGLRLQRTGRRFEPWADPRPWQALVPAPQAMPAPQAAGLLPGSLSASACEALRACPYRFYALHLLRLREADELDDTIEKRDYGNWLHAVLDEFHRGRGEPGPADAESARLLEIAHRHRLIRGLDGADFLPFEAGFAELAPRYIAWLHEREARGARWVEGEQVHRREPQSWQGIALHGRIDRIDAWRDDAGGIELIDYKTGSAAALKSRVKEPLEDTQLAFYAALVREDPGVAVRAMYLALGRDVEAVPHPEVEASADALVQGLAHDLARIRQGAGLPALGEGQVCLYCEARGLCRRDQWSAP